MAGMKEDIFSSDRLGSIKSEVVVLNNEAKLFVYPNGIIELTGEKAHWFVGKVCSLIKSFGWKINSVSMGNKIVLIDFEQGDDDGWLSSAELTSAPHNAI